MASVRAVKGAVTAMLTMASLAACAPAPAPRRPVTMTALETAPPEPPGDPRFAKTGALVADPFIAGRVAELALYGTIESRAVGPGGEPSKVWLLAEEITDRSPNAVKLALLRHESPVVRGYVGAHVLTEMRGVREAEDALLPLFSDQAQVLTLNGCLGNHTTVARYLVTLLATSPEDDHRLELARQVAEEPDVTDDVRAIARGILGPTAVTHPAAPTR